MEEASVAGESPDRSKQRESSAEPTPGSASPVPEARAERDPRLAVAREDATSSASPSSSAGSRGGVDTATKVFSIKDLRTDPGPGDSDSGSADTPEGPKGSEGSEGPESAENSDEQNPSAKGGTTGDARLRAAVAAWVTSADGSEEPEDAKTPATTPATKDSADSERTADAEVPDGAEELAGAGSAGENPANVDAEGAEDTEDTEGAEDAEAAAPAEADTSAGKAGRPGEPGKAASGDTGPADAAPEDEPVEGTEARDAAATEPDSDADATEGEQATDTEDATPADEAPEPADARPDAPEDAAPEDAAPTAAGTAATEAAKPDVTDVADAKPTDADKPSATETDAEAEGDARPEADAEAEGDAEDGDSAPRAADGASAPQAPPAPDDETRTGGAGGKTKAADGGAEALDHPTTVFKAVRPPKPEPQVDQPTTMLKLGDATKTPETRETPETPETPKAPDRTSKFVALKPLDEPRTPGRGAPPKDATRPVHHVGPEHTTQQPLPPKPPLDLLAELTNTPPPPETPVRTAIRRVKIWTPLVILLAIVFAVVQAVRPLPTPSLTLTADDSYTFDGSKVDLPWPSEGQGWMDVNGIGTMGDFGKQTPVAIGSVAKAMTAYIVLKDHPLKAGTEGEKITVDATAEKEGGYDKDGESTLNTVKAGDVLTEKQALSAIMIPSANNIARLLARWDAGSEAAFIKKMNDTAKELGMTNTTYTDASGLKETTVSSAEDQVKLGNQLVKIQSLMDITKLPAWVDPSGKKWTNYNRLVPYNNSLGIKTGTTTAAGGNLLFAATKEVGGETAVVVGAILGQHTAPIIDTVNAVSKTAMLAAQDAMTSAKILKKGTVVGYVDDQLGGHTPVVVTKDVAAVGWAGLKVKLSFVADDVPHTAKAGTKVGTLTVGDGSGGAVKVPVALQKDLAEPALTSKLTRLG